MADDQINKFEQRVRDLEQTVKELKRRMRDVENRLDAAIENMATKYDLARAIYGKGSREELDAMLESGEGLVPRLDRIDALVEKLEQRSLGE